MDDEVVDEQNFGIPVSTPETATHSVQPQPELPLIKQFYRDLIDSLTEPRKFYTKRYPQMSVSYTLAFGLTVSWIGAAIEWLTRMLHNESLLDGLIKMRNQLQVLPLWKDLPPSIWAQNPQVFSSFPAWIAEISTVALHPFSFLLSLAFSAIGLTIGAYLFIQKRKDGTQDKTDLTTFMKLKAAASTPALVSAILSFLPLGLGKLIGGIYGIAMIIFALNVRYRLSTLRSSMVYLTPWMAVLFAGTCFIGLFGAIIFGLISSFLAA